MLQIQKHLNYAMQFMPNWVWYILKRLRVTSILCAQYLMVAELISLNMCCVLTYITSNQAAAL